MLMRSELGAWTAASAPIKPASPRLPCCFNTARDVYIPHPPYSIEKISFCVNFMDWANNEKLFLAALHGSVTY